MGVSISLLLKLFALEEARVHLGLLLLPGVSEGLLNIAVFLRSLLQGQLLSVLVVGVCQVLPQCGVENVELVKAVSEAETLLDGQEGEFGGLSRTNIEAVLLEGL